VFLHFAYQQLVGLLLERVVLDLRKEEFPHFELLFMFCFVPHLTLAIQIFS
jgi:hypothetical protein